MKTLLQEYFDYVQQLQSLESIHCPEGRLLRDLIKSVLRDINTSNFIDSLEFDGGNDNDGVLKDSPFLSNFKIPKNSKRPIKKANTVYKVTKYNWNINLN